MNALSVIRNTGRGAELPALIARAGDRAARRFLEFFTVNIRNRNTRVAYARAAAVCLRWCEGYGITRLQDVQPLHVAAYIEQFAQEISPPSVKRHLACIRMLFRLVGDGSGDTVEPRALSPGAAPFGEQSVTLVLSSEEATSLLTGMDLSTVVGLRDRAIIAVMTYTPCRCRRRARRRGLLIAEETLVTPPPRGKRQGQ